MPVVTFEQADFIPVVILAACWLVVLVAVAWLMVATIRIGREVDRLTEDASSDVCGLCGRGGADVRPMADRWPGQRDPGTPFVHLDCEDREADRAMRALSPDERKLAMVAVWLRLQREQLERRVKW